MTEVCRHEERVRPVVWQLIGLDEVPNAVVCEQCGRSISTQAVAYVAYDEGKDGWYVPDKTQGKATV